MLPNIGELFRIYLQKINSFSQASQKMTFPQKYVFGKDFPYPVEIWPKTKMVRVVHMNIFYRRDLQGCDSKSEFWTKTEN